jgi:hypothetical protein
MIHVDSTYWPLVVIGPLSAAIAVGGNGAAANRGVDLARLASHEPRAVALVVPGHGDEAAGALEALLAWLRAFDGSVLAPATRLAWVAPDRALRATLDTMLTEQGHRAFGCPSSTFAALLPALIWLFEAVKARAARRAAPSFRHRLTPGVRRS